MAYTALFIQNHENPVTVSFLFDTCDAAMAKFHQELGWRAEDRDYCYGVVYDSNMMPLATEIYDKDISGTGIYTVLVNQNGESVTPFSYTDENEARALYHAELGYRAEGRNSTKVVILDRDLNMIISGTYIKEVE